MACLLELLASVAVVIGTLLGDAAVRGAFIQSVDNAEQFALLCRIYNVAKNPPTNHTDLQYHLKIMEEIDAPNASLAEQKRFNEIEKVKNSGSLSEDSNEAIPASWPQRDAGNNAVTTVASGKKHAKVNPAATGEALARIRLRQITQKAHKLIEEIRRLNVTEEIEKAKAEFAKVIFGEEANESDLCHGALKGVSGRAEACGKTGLSSKGDSAGKNLVVDFFCLCAHRADKKNGIDNVCGVQVGGKGDKADKHGWDTAAPLGSSSMWASVKKGCENLLHQHPKSTEEGHEVLKDFLKHLKSGGVYRWGTTNGVNGESSSRKEGMLGTGVGTNEDKEKDLVCNGSKGYGKSGKRPGGLCVYYGPHGWEENIEWLKQLKAALSTVDDMNRKTASVQRALEKLQMLHHRAEEIYEATKVILELENLEGLTAFQNVSGSFTAYNGTRTRSYSHNPHLYFALP
ncbi:Variant surface glycoprotein [Trypanosoma congolense IL3000]|uniref:Variant surface glycoprotein n=1 Tax=Trypanosoma congolense (strain IL3000) TaxID=1068625 RepID=F9WIY7_TRYCI|nr:Variant surface glycoprotein [Trypanosoma congolense IL3000]